MFHGELYLPKKMKVNQTKNKKQNHWKPPFLTTSSPLGKEKNPSSPPWTFTRIKLFFLPLGSDHTPPLPSCPTTKTPLPHGFVLSFKQGRGRNPVSCEFTEIINQWPGVFWVLAYSLFDSKPNLNAIWEDSPSKVPFPWPTGSLVAVIKIGQSDMDNIQLYSGRMVEKDWNTGSSWLFGPFSGAFSINNMLKPNLTKDHWGVPNNLVQNIPGWNIEKSSSIQQFGSSVLIFHDVFLKSLNQIPK